VTAYLFRMVERAAGLSTTSVPQPPHEFHWPVFYEPAGFTRSGSEPFRAPISPERGWSAETGTPLSMADLPEPLQPDASGIELRERTILAGHRALMADVIPAPPGDFGERREMSVPQARAPKTYVQPDIAPQRIEQRRRPLLSPGATLGQRRLTQILPQEHALHAITDRARNDEAAAAGLGEPARPDVIPFLPGEFAERKKISVIPARAQQLEHRPLPSPGATPGQRRLTQILPQEPTPHATRDRARNDKAAAEASSEAGPPVEITIGRVEIQFDSPAPPRPTSVPTLRPGGFAEFAALRRYAAGPWPSRNR
jgi:hypothetical protein